MGQTKEHRNVSFGKLKSVSSEDRENRMQPLSPVSHMEIDMSHVQQKRKVSDRVAYGQEESFLGYLVHSTKEVLLGSKMNVLMLLTPLAYIVDASGSDHNHGAVFLLSLSAIVPFAERLGYVTEQLAMHTNDTLGGLLNASFGNATEVIISLFALLKARPDQANAVMYQRLLLR
uniref:Sodium/calcium exchanger membrane region domain-containing protein n=1 Tax=Mucochytrium quahogii TaxID=96639 RepID=A0A7S2RJP5_9STRA|mmetsp:Transcript_1187/g.1903  ORF Transcript_1187/g.1903 Transcript_1187/m.1903 type:complete len:174 (-) Transcript_1187:261-782(-)